jgi:HPt (histidine-containing phosphotransfer) domain-containing protein
MAEAGEDVLDHAYLRELTGWVGVATLSDLAARAPDSFGLELDAMRSAWKEGDAAELRAAAHRLKGMAASLACCRLAQLCQIAQHDPVRALVDAELGARLDRELAAALDALAIHFPRQP